MFAVLASLHVHHSELYQPVHFLVETMDACAQGQVASHALCDCRVLCNGGVMHASLRCAIIPVAQPEALQQKGRLRAGRRMQRMDPAFEELCEWIDFFNGHVHHKLDLALTSLGCRCALSL